MWLVPSRRRIKKLQKFCASAIQTKTSTQAFIIVDTEDYKDNKSDYIDLELNHFPKDLGWQVHITKAESMGDKMREVWGRVREADWVGLLNDDHVMITEEWDKKLIGQLTGHNFISCNDGWVAKGKETSLPAGATLWSGELLRSVGYIFPPELQHMFIDDLWQSIGLFADCWDIDLSVTVEHEHASRDESRKDETHAKSESFMKEDLIRYYMWHVAWLWPAVKAVRELKLSGSQNSDSLHPGESSCKLN